MLPDIFTDQFLSKLELLSLRSRKKYLNLRQGIHRSLKRGHGLEFSDYRKYELGDDPRHIDWGVFARSEKVYVKKFTEEQAIGLTIIIDSSPSMHIIKKDQKLEYAKNLALAISYTALQQGDQVKIILPGVGESPRFSSIKSIHPLSDYLAKLDYQKSDNFHEETMKIIANLKCPGIAIYISDFLFEQENIAKIFKRSISKNLDTYAVQILGESDLDPTSYLAGKEPVDSETNEHLKKIITKENLTEYQTLLGQHNKQIKDLAKRLAIPFLFTESNSSLENLLIKELPKLGLLS